MSNKDCTVFTLGFLAGAAVMAISLPDVRRVAKNKVEEGIATSKQSLTHLSQSVKTGIEARKRAVSASVDAARSTYEDSLKTEPSMA